MELVHNHSSVMGRSWVLQQTWSKLLFAHWPLKAEALRPLIPTSLTIDTFDGEAWVGIVPFYMSQVRFRDAPTIPTTGEFCELNVRTYVIYRGVPGVWFFSLDATSLLAVLGARRVFRLPYYHAQMKLAVSGDSVAYRSRRIQRGSRPAAFEGTYRPVSPLISSQSGALEYWLTERYCLYAADAQGHVYRGDIEHTAWPLQVAEAELATNTMGAAVDIELPATRPLLHYAERLDVKAWHLRRIV
jgi:uncharacterized protein YqjF (DUF2071 family)